MIMDVITNQQKNSVKLSPLTTQSFSAWQNKQAANVQQWVKHNDFNATPGSMCLVPDWEQNKGELSQVLLGLNDISDLWSWAGFTYKLPKNRYSVSNDLSDESLEKAALAWMLDAYRFTQYKKEKRQPAQLCLPLHFDLTFVKAVSEGIYLTRDLINMPAEILHPGELAEQTQHLAKQFDAQFNQIIGDDLLKNNYPAIHTVGRASVHPPRLLDLVWGDEEAPKLTLIGKGVCFDTGGLDIKPSKAMLLMRKDMAGAAHVLGLAKMIMSLKLPVRLRVLIPAIENSISSNAYRPGDIITTRSGITVEVGNTDAEGRVVMADALTLGASEKPDLMIDFSSLTGAARVAVGTEIAAMFTNDEEIAQKLSSASEKTQDPLWRLPLYKPYQALNDTPFADITNSGQSPYAGAITAALFLQRFVDDCPWVHFDVMGWNLVTEPGRPQGGEAMGLRAVLSYLRDLT